ncbi:hypothetical protein LTR37_012415 [Vermiconidia calcicola]|uniref:Uncharacterized protein n=1 Tax=Vermiconidia calcicola TaxID=1690605 RepID=A0ACC3MZ67_9PEZI|nr:hypothetical protein LTR37_012415 [Vermiconidia calcicola]
MTPKDDLVAKCVATTGDAFCTNIPDSHAGRRSKPQPNRFCQAQFSRDGTSIVTESADRCIRTFILPEDLLDETTQPHNLSAYCSTRLPSAVSSLALYPHFNLHDTSTTVFLSGSTDLPITLTNAIHDGDVHAKYPFVHSSTEVYLGPNSLAWGREGTHFVAGSKNQIAVFDASYDGSGPVVTHKTAAGRKQNKLYGGQSTLGCRGIVTALSIRSDGLLAAGTTEREIGLYANEGSGECLTSFSVAADPGRLNPMKGTGVMQLAWSPDGTYLLAAERQSTGIHVYDMRNTLRRVSWLSGRQADTTQRLGIDVVPTAMGSEVWAGGTDGCVRMWKDPGFVEGEQAPDAVVKLHETSVSGAVWHPGGAVLATCSGQRTSKPDEPFTDENNVSMNFDVEVHPPENTLSIWTV